MPFDARLLLVLLVAPCAVHCDVNRACSHGETYPFCNTSLPLQARAADLVSRLKVTEKPGIMTARHSQPVPDLGIPAYDWGVNSIHGDQVSCGTHCATNYPSPVAVGASFNMSMVRALAAMMAVELRALRLEGSCEQHVSQAAARSVRGNRSAEANSGGLPDACIGLDTWAPNINMNRDPRWGRNWEVATEDPFLQGQIGAQYALGFQGTDPHYLLGVITLKHWAAYTVEENRGGYNDVVEAYDLADTYLPAFRRAVTVGRAAGMMCSYNAINGVPTCASQPLNSLLRDTWGFDGYITSDSGAISDIYKQHKYVKTAREAAAAAINAGVDINSGGVYQGSLADALVARLTNMSMVDAALARAFRTRMRLGLFDPAGGQPYTHFPPSVVGSDAHHRLSLEASRQGLVLLQNKASALPLRKGLRLAVIGPNAETRALLVGGTGGCGSGTCLSAEVVCKNATNSSDWWCVPSIADQLAALNAGGSVVVAEGAEIHKPYDQAMGAAAVAAAKAADAVVFVLGGDWQTDHEGMDRDNIRLPGGQNDLVAAVTAAIPGKPTVAVLVHGGAMDISNVTRSVSGILDASYPGMHGGQAVAEAVFGDYNPGGKLPVTIYPSSYTGQVEMGELSMAKQPGRSYRYYNGSTVFPCFWGLSYTNFSIAWTTGTTQPSHVDNSADNNTVSFVATVENTGTVSGSEVVMAFWRKPGWVHPVNASYKQLQRQLFAFERVELAPGATATVELPLTVDLLAQIDASGRRVTVPGAYDVILSRGSQAPEAELVLPFSVDGTERTMEELPPGLVPQHARR